MTEVEALTQHIETLKQLVAERNAEVIRVTMERDEARAERDALRAHVETLETQVAELNAEVATLAAERDEQRALLDAAHMACGFDHMGARVACGQCHDVWRQHAENARADAARLRDVLAREVERRDKFDAKTQHAQNNEWHIWRNEARRALAAATDSGRWLDEKLAEARAAEREDFRGRMSLILKGDAVPVGGIGTLLAEHDARVSTEARRAAQDEILEHTRGLVHENVATLVRCLRALATRDDAGREDGR